MLAALGDPKIDPNKLSVEEKTKLVQDSHGALIDLLEGEQVRSLCLQNASLLDHLPSMKIHTLFIRGAPLKELPDDMCDFKHLELCECPEFVHLPPRLYVRESCVLQCPKLTALPDDMRIGGTLYIGQCTSLKKIPDTILIRGSVILPLHLKWRKRRKHKLVGKFPGTKQRSTHG